MLRTIIPRADCYTCPLGFCNIGRVWTGYYARCYIRMIRRTGTTVVILVRRVTTFYISTARRSRGRTDRVIFCIPIAAVRGRAYRICRRYLCTCITIYLTIILCIVTVGQVLYGLICV